MKKETIYNHDNKLRVYSKYRELIDSVAKRGYFYIKEGKKLIPIHVNGKESAAEKLSQYHDQPAILEGLEKKVESKDTD